MFYWIGLIIGLYMVWGGATRSNAKPYLLLHARAGVLWKDKAHLFLMIAGLAVAVVMLALALTQ